MNHREAESVLTSGLAGCAGRFLGFGDLGFFDFVAFAGGEEEVGFEAVLAGVEVVVAAVELVEGLVGSALYDLALFDDTNLVGSPDD